MLLDALVASPALFAASAGLFGLLVGSFLNVVIHRLPIMMEREWRAHCAEIAGTDAVPEPAFNLVVPRSRCPGCGHPIGALENVPVLSYVALGGRCRACRMAISLRYPAVEITGAVLAGVTAWQLGPGVAAVLACLLTWALVALSVIDYDHQLLPDSITLPFLWLGLAVNLFEIFCSLETAVIGAMAGYLSLWSVYWLFRLATGKEGMGFGDFKLLAMLGAWLGWQAVPLIVVLSSLVGAAVGVTLIASGRLARGKPIPFGPYLAMAGWIALLWGHDLTSLYLRWAVGAG